MGLWSGTGGQHPPHRNERHSNNHCQLTSRGRQRIPKHLKNRGMGRAPGWTGQTCHIGAPVKSQLLRELGRGSLRGRCCISRLRCGKGLDRRRERRPRLPRRSSPTLPRVLWIALTDFTSANTIRCCDAERSCNLSANPSGSRAARCPRTFSRPR